MALNDYNENEYLPAPLRVWLKSPNKVNVFRAYDYLRIFEGFDLLAVMNNNFASDLASGYTNANVSNLMSGVAPRLLEILTNRIVSKADYTGFEECEKLQKAVSKEYLSIKLERAFSEGIRTGRDILVLYPKEDETKKVKIRNVNLFRHKIIYDDEDIKETFILVDKINSKANESYMVFEHRFYGKDGKPYQEYTIEFYKWAYDDDLSKTEKTTLDKDTIKNLIISLDPIIAEQLKEYKFYNKIELPFNDLGCYPIVNSLYNSKFPNTKIPESRFVNIQDKVMEIENSITYKEIDKNLGRGRAVIPSSFSFEGVTPMGNTSNLANTRAFANPMDKTYFVKYQTGDMNNATPQAMQFDIRAEQWRTSLNGEIGDICAAFGISILDYDPRLLQAGQRTDDEINAMTDITANTVTSLRAMNEYSINAMLDSIAKYVGEETPIKIKWCLSSIINPTKNQTLIGQMLTNGTISRLEAVKRSNPDISTKELEEELARIEKERAITNESLF